VEIPARNWSLYYQEFKKQIEAHIEENCIVLTACGLCSPVLINDLTNQQNITCLDIGSAFDLIGGKRNSRGWPHKYRHEMRYYKPLLPKGWR
jgi:hypothetical protein